MNVFINNKELINNLYQDAMAYIPALELDAEINLLSNTYYSTIMSLLHFGEGELNFRTGERFKTLKLSPQIITYSNKQLKEWNDRGIVTIDRSIKTIKEFIESGSHKSPLQFRSKYIGQKSRYEKLAVTPSNS